MSRQGHIAKKCVRRCAKAGRKRKQIWSKGYTTRRAAVTRGSC